MDANWGSVRFYYRKQLAVFDRIYLNMQVMMGLVDILSNLFCVFAIPIVGKRLIMLLGLCVVAICCFGVAANAYFYLTFDTSSFEKQPVSEMASTEDNPYALALFVCLGIGASVSGCVPWMMNSEVYPFR